VFYVESPVPTVASCPNARIGLAVDRPGMRCHRFPAPVPYLLSTFEPPVTLKIPEDQLAADSQVEEGMDLILGPDESEPE
jgi:hypothetical protein